jgi:tetratricopeptide (TPR) repeat protein
MTDAALATERGQYEDLLAGAVLGGGLAIEAERLIREAGLHYGYDAAAELHLRAAQAIAPDHAAVRIAFYRFYFYKGRLAEALEVARECLKKAARDTGLAADWRLVCRQDADFQSFDAVLPRFYLFTLKGFAYLQMRLGNTDEGRAAVMKLLELDPADKLGATVLLGVLERMGKNDDD